MASDLDRALEILSNSKRRQILRLVDSHGVLAQADVVDQSDRQTEIELVHMHLPKLADAGYIEWGRDTETISTGPRFEEVKACIDLLDAHAEKLPGEFP